MQKSPLTVIPGVGKTIAKDLESIGIYKISDLKNKNPQKLYEDLCDRQGMVIDRCMLYVMRCAVYYASTDHHDSEKLKWWNWKEASDI